jgi:hypothetical protein
VCGIHWRNTFAAGITNIILKAMMD